MTSLPHPPLSLDVGESVGTGKNLNWKNLVSVFSEKPDDLVFPFLIVMSYLILAKECDNHTGKDEPK